VGTERAGAPSPLAEDAAPVRCSAWFGSNNLTVPLLAQNHYSSLRSKGIDDTTDDWTATTSRTLGRIGARLSVESFGRKRFTLAHELGHYVIPTHAQQSVACRSSSIERWTPSMPTAELEANRFAAAILMPHPVLLTQLRKEPSLVVHDQQDAVALVASQDVHFTVFAWSPCESMVHAHRVDTLLL
jgi:IrrE N-terminal-like domain